MVLVSVPVRVQLLPRFHQKSNSGTNCCTKLKWNACLPNVFVQNTQGGWGGGGGGGYAIDGGTLNRIGSIGTSGLLCVLSGVFEWALGLTIRVFHVKVWSGWDWADFEREEK